MAQSDELPEHIDYERRLQVINGDTDAEFERIVEDLLYLMAELLGEIRDALVKDTGYAANES